MRDIDGGEVARRITVFSGWCVLSFLGDSFEPKDSHAKLELTVFIWMCVLAKWTRDGVIYPNISKTPKDTKNVGFFQEIDNLSKTML